MNIDWKAFIGPLVERGAVVILTIIATKWSDAAIVVQRLLAGDTVPLYGGALNLNLNQIELWITGGIIMLASAIWGWYRRVSAKRDVKIALQLPKGATKMDVAEVAQSSPVLSSDVDYTAISRLARAKG